MFNKSLSELIKEENYKKLKKLNFIKYQMKINKLYHQEIESFLKMIKQKNEQLELLFEDYDRLAEDFELYIKKWNDTTEKYLADIMAAAMELSHDASDTTKKQLLSALEPNNFQIEVQPNFSQSFNKKHFDSFKSTLHDAVAMLKTLKMHNFSKPIITKQYDIINKKESRRREMQLVNENKFILQKILQFGYKLNDLDYKLELSKTSDRDRINKEIFRVEKQKDECFKRLNELPKIYQIGG